MKTGSRLRKVACECGTIAYQSRAAIARGLLGCPCGGFLIPDDPDDAALVLSPEELEAHEGVRELRRETERVHRGQAGPARSLRGAGMTFRDPEEVAQERYLKARRERMRASQLAALEAQWKREDEEPIPF